MRVEIDADAPVMRHANWTLQDLPGKRMGEVPLLVRTSQFTFSAAEGFTSNLGTRERATLVGETTGGGVNPGDSFSVDEGFLMSIPTSRASNPALGSKGGSPKCWGARVQLCKSGPLLLRSPSTNP